MDEDIEIRHLSNTILETINNFFTSDESALSLLMGHIVTDPNDPDCMDLRFTSNDIDKIRAQARKLLKSPILILFDEWQTMGKNRAKLKHLLSLLIKCQLFRAADYVAQLIGRRAVERPTAGPAAAVDISLSDEVKNIVNGHDYPDDDHDNVNKNLPDNKPAINAPNLDVLNNNEATQNSQSANVSLPLIPHQVVNMTRSNIQIQSRPDLIDLNTRQSTRLETGPFRAPVRAASENLLPALSALQISAQIPATVQPEQSSQSSYIPAFSGLIANETSSQSNGLPSELQMPDIGSNSTGPAFSKIFSDSGPQKSSTQSTMQSSSNSDSETESE